jgi:hypothetical protein
MALGKVTGDRLADLRQVDLFHALHAVVHAMEIEELLRRVGETPDIVQQFLLLPAVRHRLQIGLQNRDRGAQLMGSVGEKAPLLRVAVVETRQRRVHGLDERKPVALSASDPTRRSDSPWPWPSSVAYLPRQL